MCNKLQKKIFSVLALPFAFSIFMMSAGVTPAKAAEEAGSATTEPPAVTVNHNDATKSAAHAGRNGGNKTTTHASGRNGDTKSTTHASATRSGQAKPRAAGTHTGDKTHTQQKNTAPRKATHQ